MKVNLLKQYDYFSIESDLDMDIVINRIKKHVYLDYHYGLIGPIFNEKRYYGNFNYPDRFVLKNNNHTVEGITGKNETEIQLSKRNGRTRLEFSIQNIGTKLFLIIMTLPFIGYFGYFIFDSNFDINLKYLLIILSIPTLILIIGFFIIRINIVLKKSFFEKLLE